MNLGTWIAIGVGIGAAFGIIFDQPVLSAAIGAGIGTALASSSCLRRTAR